MRSLYLITIWVTVTLCGCASSHTVSAELLIPLQSSSSYHPLFCVGSDDDYHYFSHLNAKYWRYFRVPRSELSLDRTIRRGSGESEVMWPGTLEKALIR